MDTVEERAKKTSTEQIWREIKMCSNQEKSNFSKLKYPTSFNYQFFLVEYFFKNFANRKKTYQCLSEWFQNY